MRVIIKVKSKPIVCPICEYEFVGTIKYGNPKITEQLKLEIDKGQTIVRNEIYNKSLPEWECKNCGVQFKWSEDIIKLLKRKRAGRKILEYNKIK